MRSGESNNYLFFVNLSPGLILIEHLNFTFIHLSSTIEYFLLRLFQKNYLEDIIQ